MSSSTGPTAFERLRSEKTRLIQSGYDKGTIRSDIRYLVVSKDVRRHRLISISYISHGRCHGRGREFESRRPCHSFPMLTRKVPSTVGIQNMFAGCSGSDLVRALEEAPSH